MDPDVSRTRTTAQRFSGFSAKVASPKGCCSSSICDMETPPVSRAEQVTKQTYFQSSLSPTRQSPRPRPLLWLAVPAYQAREGKRTFSPEMWRREQIPMSRSALHPKGEGIQRSRFFGCAAIFGHSGVRNGGKRQLAHFHHYHRSPQAGEGAHEPVAPPSVMAGPVPSIHDVSSVGRRGWP